MNNKQKPRTPKKEFIENIAKIEDVLPLLGEDDSRFKIDGYTHKDGTKVLLSDRWEYDYNDDGVAEDVTENQGRVILLKGNDYLCFSHKHTLGFDYLISELKVSIGKTDQNIRETILLKGDDTLPTEGPVEKNIAKILKDQSPVLYNEYRKYVPEGVNVMGTLRSLRAKKNILQYKSGYHSEAEKSAAKAMFDKALDKWKITK